MVSCFQAHRTAYAIARQCTVAGLEPLLPCLDDAAHSIAFSCACVCFHLRVCRASLYSCVLLFMRRIDYGGPEDGACATLYGGGDDGPCPSGNPNCIEGERASRHATQPCRCKHLQLPLFARRCHYALMAALGLHHCALSLLLLRIRVARAAYPCSVPCPSLPRCVVPFPLSVCADNPCSGVWVDGHNYAFKGACCQAPYLPTPSTTATSTGTATQTGTSTQTSTGTATATMTATSTRTGSVSVTPSMTVTPTKVRQ